MTIVHNRNLPGYIGTAWHVQVGDRHFVVSGVNAPLSGWEVLAFPADADGEVESFVEVAGWRGDATHEAVIQELEELFA